MVGPLSGGVENGYPSLDHSSIQAVVDLAATFVFGLATTESIQPSLSSTSSQKHCYVSGRYPKGQVDPTDTINSYLTNKTLVKYRDLLATQKQSKPSYERNCRASVLKKRQMRQLGNHLPNIVNMTGPIFLEPGRLFARHFWRVSGTSIPHQAHQPLTQSIITPLPAKIGCGILLTAPHHQTSSSYHSTSKSPASTSRRSYSSAKMATQFQKITLSQGTGTSKPRAGDTVTMHYDGYLHDPNGQDNKGTKFDSSRDRGSPFQTRIGVGQVIQGWDQGVVQMTVGEKARLIIPSNMGYGDRGFPGHIPPKATLIFDVELIKIN
ncbi:hypothetical protein R6Q59_009819 [Mikania micrantha]